MSTFTPRQREVLKRRLALAIAWKSTTAYARDEASRMALTIIDAIEDNASTAMAMRRATEAIVRKIEADEGAA